MAELKIKSLVAQMLSQMTFTEAVKQLDSLGEEHREEVVAEIWKQYHEKCAKESADVQEDSITTQHARMVGIS